MAEHDQSQVDILYMRQLNFELICLVTPCDWCNQWMTFLSKLYQILIFFPRGKIFRTWYSFGIIHFHSCHFVGKYYFLIEVAWCFGLRPFLQKLLAWFFAWALVSCDFLPNLFLWNSFIIKMFMWWKFYYFFNDSKKVV